MKAKGVYLGTQEAIFNAYSPEIREKLSKDLDMLQTFYPRAAFSDGKTDLSLLKDVSYGFSTWGCPILDAEQVKTIFPSLKAIFYAAGSVQEFARPYMENGVRIVSAWAANAIPVAETAVAEIILANKGIFQTMHRDGPEWTEHDFGKPYTGNFDVNVGLLGAGMIGRKVISLLKNYRLNVLVFDPFLSLEEAERLGVEKVEKIQDVFARSRVVSNHLANNPQTVGMIDKSCFEKMGKGSVFINTGRGMTTVVADMIDMLKKDPTKLAVLDVTDPEEPPKPGNELLSLHNVILTPHIAGSIGNEVYRMGE